MFGQDAQLIATWLAAVAAIVTAVVGLLKWVFKPPELTLNWAVGKWFLFSAVIAAAWAIGFFMPGHGATTAAPGTGAPPSSASNTPRVVPEVPSSGGSSVAGPLHFVSPQQNKDVGKVVSVTLRGAVPAREQLWIVVQSSGEYYVQGKPDRQAGETWFLPGINLGSSSPDDNGPYTIMALVVTPETDSKLQQELAETHGETGIKEIPDGAGTEPLSVTVNRTHL